MAFKGLEPIAIQGAHLDLENCVAGVDEAGRGPLAGPVVAAAVVFDPNRPPIAGLRDSKQLSATAREALFEAICDPNEGALAWAVGEASVAEIDAINILQASLLAMRRAVMALSVRPQAVWVDGCQCPELPIPVKAFVKGDRLFPVISAASIVAKVVRDRQLVALDALYPGYGLAQHKGYPTRQHLAALALRGVSVVHRRSFAPVRAALGVPNALARK